MSIGTLIAYVAVGLVAGAIMGYVLGLAVLRVRSLGTEAKNTYTITKDELERIENEAAEV